MRKLINFIYMKNLFIIILLTVFLGACATMPDETSSLDLTATIDQLQGVHLKSMEAQRKIAEGILDYTLFHLGFWEVMIETSHVRPSPKVTLAIVEIKKMAVIRDNLPPGEALSDYQMSRTVGWGVVLAIGILEHIPGNMPQMAQLLALF